jgi:hypothetical protein
MMFYVSIRASPGPLNPNFGLSDGVYFNFWFRDASGPDAEGAARSEIESGGWVVRSVIASYAVRREQYIDSRDALECFDIAEEDGRHLEINQHPVGALHPPSSRA